ncbi:MAG: type I-E CRISPR-associated protein Cse1/CasA, partial [Nitrososphaeria archaeon]|nr:type I-E CRISPR-associated protein Cse1/CasA [Nitrososphaeria archaeon]
MNGFNLVDEPWVPCIFPGQSRAQLLSLRDTFRRAHEVADLGDRSPLVTAALYRLLLAVLHRVYGPRDEEAWEELWNQGSFDEGVERYLTQWRERFDLFHPTHPFYQVAGLEADLAGPAHKLSLDFSGGDNPLLFDHTTDENPLAITPDEPARYLLAAQSFAAPGILVNRRGVFQSGKASHLFRSAVILNIGSNLFETLMLNLVAYHGAAEQPFEFDDEDDIPAWEDDQPTRPETRRLRGYLDLLTWQSRQVLLFR